ncbi:Gfo/Idh/MocA family oxidoreductase [bacterium]|nr:Gfo/Idh/MocA family oxidoreductase [bacterium]
MKHKQIRIGLIGAGANTLLKHIPELQKIEGVHLVSVCNRSTESSEKVAREYDIPHICQHWSEIIKDNTIDAVVIGTWPYLHQPVTCAALDAGKHVLCEARMAMNAAEAQTMLAAARRHPECIAQLVPAPFTFSYDQTILDLVATGFLGDILTVSLRHNGNEFIQFSGPLTWRQDIEYSGFNTLYLGVWYESLARWIGHARTVMAMTRTFVPLRRDKRTNHLKAVLIPDHIDCISEFACGAQVNMQFSTVTGLASPYSEIWLHGTEGTVHLDLVQQKLMAGQRGDLDLREIPIDADKKASWRVEQEFINAIRGQERVVLTSFEEGARYMEFTEAVIRSAQTGQLISLPL